MTSCAVADLCSMVRIETGHAHDISFVVADDSRGKTRDTGDHSLFLIHLREHFAPWRYDDGMAVGDVSAGFRVPCLGTAGHEYLVIQRARPEQEFPMRGACCHIK